MKEYLLTAQVGIGFQIGDDTSIIPDIDSYYEVNFLYGRMFKLHKNIYWDIHGGVGYFAFGVDDFDSSENAIALPISTKFRFMIGNKFSTGLQFHTNINAEQTIYSAGLVFQFNR